MSTQKSFSIKPGQMIAMEWNGTTDTNGDGDLTFVGDAVKSFEVLPEKIVYYDSLGAPSVTVDINGTTLH